MSDIQSNKKLRAVEFALVIFVALAPLIFRSTFILLTGRHTDKADSFDALYFGGIISQVSTLMILVYVLFRQGRSLAKIGLTFAWMDLAYSVLLVVVVYGAAYIWSAGTIYGYYFVTKSVPNVRPQNVEFLAVGITLPSLIYVLLNPFYEELIVRAFTISEVKYLTKRSSLAVITSVVLQTSYHLYQGAFAAWSYVPIFLIFSLYYVKWKRITPVILAHLYFDLWALLAMSRH
jgi:membrane protease YdiL (CAAX protease family)